MQRGSVGFKRLTSGTHVAGAGSHTDVTEFFSIKTIGTTALAFGANSVAVNGDIPTSADVLAQGDELVCRFTTIHTTAGVCFAWFR